MEFGDEAMKSRDSDFSHRENAAGESIQSRILNLHVVSLGGKPRLPRVKRIEVSVAQAIRHKVRW
jgi:hypothetical protein